MRKFGMISTRVWRSTKFSALEGPTARLVYLYLHTSQNANSAGCFMCVPEIIAKDVRCTADEAIAALDDLERVGLIRRDADEHLVQITNFFMINSPTSRKQLAGPMFILDELPRVPVVKCARAELAIDIYQRAKNWNADVEARGVFMQTAADLLADIDADIQHRIGLSIALSIELSEALLIGLSTKGEGNGHGKLEDHGDGEDHGEDQDHGEGVQGERVRDGRLASAPDGARRPDPETAQTIAELRARAGKKR